MIRVLLADDESLTRVALRDYLASDPSIEVVGDASNGRLAIQQTRSLEPDIVLMDMQMPIMNGVEATRAIRESSPEVAVLGLTTFTTDEYVVEVLRAGAAGYLVKDTPPREIIDAVHQVAAGEFVISPEVTRHVIRGVADSVPAVAAPDPVVAEQLNEKDLEVIDLLARGMSNREIAAELFVAESTVKSRFIKVREKLDVRDRVQILVKAVEYGLVSVRPLR